MTNRIRPQWEAPLRGCRCPGCEFLRSEGVPDRGPSPFWIGVQQGAEMAGLIGAVFLMCYGLACLLGVVS